MGFRFRRSVRLFPGLRLNVSRSGVSASIGRRGAWFTLGPRGTRATIGSPGTGLSYTEETPWKRIESTANAPGLDVAELPREDIQIAAPLAPAESTPGSDWGGTHDDDLRDPWLAPIMLIIVGIIAVAAVTWALLV